MKEPLKLQFDFHKSICHQIFDKFYNQSHLNNTM